MKVETRFYAFLREATGVERDSFELEEGATVGDLLRAIAARYERLAGLVFEGAPRLRRGFALALNGENVELDKVDEIRLREGDTVVILPPIAGGYSILFIE